MGREGEQALHTLARYCRMTRVHMRTKKIAGAGGGDGGRCCSG